MKKLIKTLLIGLIYIALTIFYLQTPGGKKALDDADKGITTDVF